MRRRRAHSRATTRATARPERAGCSRSTWRWRTRPGARYRRRPRSLDEALLPEQRVHIRRPAAEVDEGVERLLRSALRQDGVEEALRDALVEHALFLEGREGIGAEHFGPLVAVVTRRVAASEDVAEVVWHAIELGQCEDGHLIAHLAEDLADARSARRVVFGVQPEIEQRELELANRRKTGMESARA